MIRILLFLVLVLVMGFGFAWLADRPGDMTIVWQGQRIEMSLMVAVTAVVSLVAAIMIAWWLIKTLFTSPRTIARYFRASKRDRGYEALSTGLIAAGAGDSGLARKMNKRSKGLLNADQEPLIHLLDLQAALIEGRHDEVRSLLEAMVNDPETKALGLRGLYLEAKRQGAEEAARHYAETAAAAAPQLKWAGEATLANRTQEGNWDEALHLLERQKQAGMLERKEAERKKAVLLTARANERYDSDPHGARDDGAAALRLAPGFVPAALVAARALFREDNLRRGSKILETVWKAGPHPEVAEAYVRARIGDSAADRLKRAQRLESLRPHHVESLIAVARAALDAHRFELARQKAEAAARMQPREGIFLLLADIEETETGDQGRIRHWLSLALRAPRDPAWTADGYVSESWEPVSPVTGKLDAFEWKVAVEQLSGPKLDHDAVSASFDKAISSLPSPASGPGAAVPAATEKKAVSEKKAGRAAQPEVKPATGYVETVAPASLFREIDPVSDALAPVSRIADLPAVEPVDRKPAEDNPGGKFEEENSGPAVEAEPAESPAEKENSFGHAEKTQPVAQEDHRDDAESEEELFLSHRPDDPGIDPDTSAEPKQRFKLF